MVQVVSRAVGLGLAVDFTTGGACVGMWSRGFGFGFGFRIIGFGIIGFGITGFGGIIGSGRVRIIGWVGIIGIIGCVRTVSITVVVFSVVIHLCGAFTDGNNSLNTIRFSERD